MTTSTTPTSTDALTTGAMSTALARAQVAVNRARAAQGAWASMGVAARVAIIERFRRLVFAERAAIARTVSEESGKPLPEAYVADVAMALEGAAFLVSKARGTLAPKRLRSRTLAAWRKVITVHHDPYGVVAVVAPWNYPFFFPAMHTMTALVAGNAVVLKPSEQTPRSADHIVRLLHQAGVPSDVLIMLHGDGRMGAGLVSASVDKVFFTGSERTGRAIAESCAPRFVPVSLELGGSDAAVVLEDADIASASSGILWGRFTNAGQTCVASKRVVAVGKAYDALCAALVRGVQGLEITADGSVDMGPLVSAPQRALIASQLDDAIAQGATVLVQREPRATTGSAAADRMMPAVVLTNVSPEMRVWQEETFGPVLVAVRAESERDAIRMANDSRYGLSASVWTGDRERGARVAAQLETGTAVINDTVIAAGLPEVPHGGVKASGLGRIHGTEGLLECVRTRTVVDDRLPRMRQPWWFGYGASTTANLDAYLRLAHGVSWGERLSGLAGTIRLLLRPERPL